MGRSAYSFGDLGSFGRPSTRSPTMLRWISAVPPQIVSDREKKNADIIGLTSYVSRPLARAVAGHEPLVGWVFESIADAPKMSSASSMASRCISDQNIL